MNSLIFTLGLVISGVSCFMSNTESNSREESLEYNLNKNDDDDVFKFPFFFKSLFQNSIPLKENSCKCGNENSEHYIQAVKYSYGLKVHSNRIKNGRPSFKKDFLARITIFKNIHGGLRIAQCMGSLINHRFVLTAAHCVCNSDPPKIYCEEKMEDENIIKNNILIKIGLSNLEEDNGESYVETYANGIYVPYERVFMEKNSEEEVAGPFDIALLRTRDWIHFKKGSVQPICLPITLDPEIEEIGSHVYVAGFGSTFFRSEPCTTNSQGPSQFTSCLIKTSSLLFDDPNRNSSTCQETPTPSETDIICSEFFERCQKHGISIIRFMAVNVLSLLGSRKCYVLKGEQNGWCKTSEILTSDSGWGYCETSLCKQRSEMTKELLETVVTSFKDETCTRENDKEFCVGSFSKISTKNIATFYLPHRQEEKPIKIGVSYKEKSFFGGSDACQGDSGAPYFRWYRLNKTLRAFQVGIVSRGPGCGTYNKPGLATNVKSFLKWIQETSMEGGCQEYI